MAQYLYDQRGNAVGFIRGRLIHDMRGNAIAQIHGTHVHKLNGPYVGELYKDMVVNRHMGNYGNVGHSGNPGNAGSPGMALVSWQKKNGRQWCCMPSPPAKYGVLTLH